MFIFFRVWGFNSRDLGDIYDILGTFDVRFIFWRCQLLSFSGQDVNFGVISPLLGTAIFQVLFFGFTYWDFGFFRAIYDILGSSDVTCMLNALNIAVFGARCEFWGDFSHFLELFLLFKY